MLIAISASAQPTDDLLILDEGRWLAWAPTTRTLRETGIPPANLIHVDAQGQQTPLTTQPDPATGTYWLENR